MLLGSFSSQSGCHVIEPVFGSVLGYEDIREQLSANLGSLSRWCLPSPKVCSELELSPRRGAGMQPAAAGGGGGRSVRCVLRFLENVPSLSAFLWALKGSVVFKWLCKHPFQEDLEQAEGLRETLDNRPDRPSPTPEAGSARVRLV